MPRTPTIAIANSFSALDSEVNVPLQSHSSPEPLLTHGKLDDEQIVIQNQLHYSQIDVIDTKLHILIIRMAITNYIFNLWYVLLATTSMHCCIQWYAFCIKQSILYCWYNQWYVFCSKQYKSNCDKQMRSVLRLKGGGSSNKLKKVNPNYSHLISRSPFISYSSFFL